MGIISPIFSDTENDQVLLAAGDIIDTTEEYDLGFERAAIYVKGDGTTVTVEGGAAIFMPIDPGGASVVGIRARADDVTINFAGDIYSDGEFAYGILSDGSGTTLNASGLIEMNGYGAQGIFLTDSVSDISADILMGGNDAQGVVVIGETGSVVDFSGNLAAFGDFSVGIRLFSFNGDDSRHSLDMSGNITTFGFFSDGIFGHGDLPIDYDVSGTITTYGDRSFGLNNETSDATINVSGDTETYGFLGVGIVNFGHDTSIDFTGSTMTFGERGYGIYSDANNVTINMDGSLVSSGTRGHGVWNLGNENVLNVSGTIDVTGFSTFGTIQSGENNATTVTGDISAVRIGVYSQGSGNTIDVSGHVFGGLSAIEAQGIESVNITGTVESDAFFSAVIFSRGGTREIDVSGTVIGPGYGLNIEDYGTLDVSGTVTISADATFLRGVYAAFGESADVSGSINVNGLTGIGVELLEFDQASISGNFLGDYEWDGSAVSVSFGRVAEISGNLTLNAPSGAALFASNVQEVVFSGDASADGAIGILATNIDYLSVSGTVTAGGDNAAGLVAGLQFYPESTIDISGRIHATGQQLPVDPFFPQGPDGVAIEFVNFDPEPLVANLSNSGEIVSDNGAGIRVTRFTFFEGAGIANIHNEAGGLISGVVGIQGHDGVENVINDGRIVGDVLLDSGDDTFTASGASRVEGLVDGGDGNDVISGSNGSDTFLGGAGNDTISGGNGADVIVGGEGDDMLTGGNGPDTFHTGANSGNDVITDFGAEDTIVFNDGSGVTGLGDLTVVDTVDGALIDWGTGDSILLSGVDSSDLNDGQFAFGGDAPSATALPGMSALLDTGGGEDLGAMASLFANDMQGSPSLSHIANLPASQSAYDHGLGSMATLLTEGMPVGDAVA